MNKRILLNFSENAIKQEINVDFCPSKNSHIVLINGEYYFEFDILDFTHACFEMRNGKDQSNEDLFYSFHTISGYFDFNNNQEHFTLNTHNTDSKRTLSEGFGVAFGVLLVHKTYNVRWENISQVPIE